MNFSREDHTFVICAYKESPYLWRLILSLKKQTVKSRIIMVTSTDNSLIRSMGEKYEIPVFVNHGKPGIVEDWNFGYEKAETRLVTIAHQDDVYMNHYTENMLEMVGKAGTPLIYFTDYGELRNGKRINNNRLLKIKRMMLIPLERKSFRGSRFVRRRILSFGNPICCPSVTYVKDNLPARLFQPGFICSQDWQAWEKISRIKGEFLYDKKILMYHRIHEDSTTSEIVNGGGRSNEDYQMFCKFWPKPAARILTHFYSASEKSNDL